ncbi:hypothetical protein B0H15DRAFT_807876 [Mycena belliarum]|uniref:Uncharacterized protein n=1 Tax=Mycena belliarum TaxID=1033014 RepID=A0AAD6TLY3_9AGAR|nr:hypothetical protein B0H15DRAFT_807876 [Mycena belliae]
MSKKPPDNAPTADMGPPDSPDSSESNDSATDLTFDQAYEIFEDSLALLLSTETGFPIPEDQIDDLFWTSQLFPGFNETNLQRRACEETKGFLNILKACLIDPKYSVLTAGSFIKYKSKFKFTFSSGFSYAKVDILNGAIDFSAGVGVVMDLNFNGTVGKQKLPNIPLSPLTIPGIIVVGPYILIQAELSYKVALTGKVLARASVGWSNINAEVDMVGRESSIGDWVKASTAPLVSVEITGTGSITPAVTKYDLAAGVEVKASLSLTLSAAITAGTGKPVEFQNDCIGINAELKANLEVYEPLRFQSPKGVKLNLWLDTRL